MGIVVERLASYIYIYCIQLYIGMMRTFIDCAELMGISEYIDPMIKQNGWRRSREQQQQKQQASVRKMSHPPSKQVMSGDGWMGEKEDIGHNGMEWMCFVQ